MKAADAVHEIEPAKPWTGTRDGPARRLIGRLCADLEVRPDILRHLGRRLRTRCARQRWRAARGKQTSMVPAPTPERLIENGIPATVSRWIVPPWPIGSAAYLRFPRCCVFRKRTPGPPPFSLTNSIPALSNAEIIFFPVSLRPPSGPFCASSRLIVGIETPAAAARSPWDQAKRARAALICLIDTFSIDFLVIVRDTFSIESPGCRRIIYVSSFFEVRHQT
jgi:hypothetical protein